MRKSTHKKDALVNIIYKLLFRFTSLNSDLATKADISDLNNKQATLKFKVVWCDIEASLDSNTGYYKGYVGLNSYSFSGFVSNALYNIPYGSHIKDYGYGVCSIEIRDGNVYICTPKQATYSVGILQIYT